MQTPDDEAEHHKVLLLAIVFSILKEGRVEFCLRPKLSKQVALKSIVPRNASSEHASACGRKSDSCRSLQIESPDSFSIGDRRRDYRVKRSVLILPGGPAQRQVSGQDVVSAFLIC